MKICPVRAELFQADGQTDRHDQANTRFFFNFVIAYQKASVTVFVRMSWDAWGLEKEAGIAQPV
jgi:hypothetical protein